MRGQGKLRVAGLASIFVVCLMLIGLDTIGASPSPQVSIENISLEPGIIFRQVTIPASEDTWINQWRPTTNYGRANLMLRSANVASALIKFPLDAIPYPLDVAVAQATLKLYVIGSTNYNPLWAYAYGVNRPWDANEATWVQATASDAWLRSGCDAVPEDRSGDASPEVGIFMAETYISLDVTEIVRAWLNGTAPNNGILVKASSGASVEWELASADHANPAFRPQLQVLFTVIPTPTPTITPSPTPIQPALQISKTGPEGVLDLIQGSIITYTIAVNNIGTQDAHGVVITDVLPYGTTYVGSTPAGVQSSENVIWEIGTLFMGDGVTIQIAVSLAALVKDSGLVVNVARANCDNGCTEVYSDWPNIINPIPTATPTSPRMLYLPLISRDSLYRP